MSLAEEIKSKLDIVEVIREYIQVKAAGVNFQALCPFHQEKTPSFIISPEKQIWHCFGCGKGGDVLSFVQEIEGLSFVDTLKLLAPKAGVVFHQENIKEYSKRARLLDCLASATKKYISYLNNDIIGQKMKAYLLTRGLTEETIKDWQIGYSPKNWTALFDYLRSQKFTESEIFAAGLAIRNERGSIYDRFRDRIIFPIRDINGTVIAFTARINPEEKDNVSLGKYINSPQTEIYDKSRVLFALDKAKKAIKDRGFAIIVEGQMDAISCHQHGFTNTVASSGTALTIEQLKLIKRFSNNLMLAFDMDSAGQLAADRGIKEAMALEMNIKIIVLPSQYKDPDECLRVNPDDFKQAVLKAKPMMEYYFDKIKEGKDLNKISDKKEVAKLMLNMIYHLANKIDRDYWLQHLAENLNISEQVLRESLSIIKTKEKKVVNIEASSSFLEFSREEKLSEILLALLLKSPDFINYSISHLEPDDLSGEKFILFYKNLIIYYNKFTVLDYDSFRLYLQEQADGSVDLIDRLVLLGEKDYYNYDYNQLKTEITKVLSELKRFSLKRQIKLLQQQISIAEAKGDQESISSLMMEIKKLTEQLN